MQFQTVEEIEQSLLDNHRPGEEIAPGVVISRRAMLSLSALALAWLALPAPVRAQLRSEAKGAQGERIEVVMAEVRRLAETLIATDDADEETYLKAVHALVQRMRAAPEPWYGWRMRPDKWAMDVVWYCEPVALYQLKFEPEAVIDLHDHRHYNGLLLGVRGSIEVRNFDFVPEKGMPLDLKKGVVPPAGREFLVRETAKQVLEPGKVSTLTRDRDNLHVVKAGPEGGECLDLFTHFNNKARSYPLEWTGKPEPGTTDRYRASWKAER